MRQDIVQKQLIMSPIKWSMISLIRRIMGPSLPWHRLRDDLHPMLHLHSPSTPFVPSLPVLPMRPTTRERQGEKKRGLGEQTGGSSSWEREGRGGREWMRGGRGRRKKSENLFWNPFSIRGPQAVITGVPEWGPVSENVSYPFLKWNLIWEAQRWRGQRICKLLSIPAVNGNFISVRWHSPLFTVDHLNGCLKRRWAFTLPLSNPLPLPSVYLFSPLWRDFFYNVSMCLFYSLKRFSHAMYWPRDFSGNIKLWQDGHQSFTCLHLRLLLLLFLSKRKLKSM